MMPRSLYVEPREGESQSRFQIGGFYTAMGADGRLTGEGVGPREVEEEEQEAATLWEG